MYIVKETIKSYTQGHLMEIYHMTYEWDGSDNVKITEDERNVGYSYPVPKREPTRQFLEKHSEIPERIKEALSDAKSTGNTIELGIHKE